MKKILLLTLCMLLLSGCETTTEIIMQPKMDEIDKQITMLSERIEELETNNYVDELAFRVVELEKKTGINKEGYNCGQGYKKMLCWDFEDSYDIQCVRKGNGVFIGEGARGPGYGAWGSEQCHSI